MRPGVQQRGSCPQPRGDRLSSERSVMGEGDLYYVQVRYPRGDRWITIACDAVRRDAARVAALAFPEVVNAGGEHAMQGRVIGWGLLDALGLEHAERDLAPERGRQDSNLRPSA